MAKSTDSGACDIADDEIAAGLALIGLVQNDCSRAAVLPDLPAPLATDDRAPPSRTIFRTRLGSSTD